MQSRLSHLVGLVKLHLCHAPRVLTHPIFTASQNSYAPNSIKIFTKWYSTRIKISWKDGEGRFLSTFFYFPWNRQLTHGRYVDDGNLTRFFFLYEVQIIERIDRMRKWINKISSFTKRYKLIPLKTRNITNQEIIHKRPFCQTDQSSAG
jgi:hypothetical protein